MWSYFVFKNITYNIRKGPLLRLPAAKSTSYGINSVLFRACLLWNSLPQSIKYSESIVELKTKMKDLGNIECSCILCWWTSIKNKSVIHPVDAWTCFDINMVCSWLCMAASLILPQCLLPHDKYLPYLLWWVVGFY